MVGSYIMLGLALTSSNYVVNENTSNVYDITYSFTMDNSFLTRNDEFGIELYDVLGLNGIEVDLGQVIYETSSREDFEYYYKTSIQIIDIDNEYLYTYSVTQYCDSYDTQQWLTINIGGQAFINTTNIDDYLGATFRLNFRFFCSSADTFTKTPLKTSSNAKVFHFDEKATYNFGYQTGYNEGYDNGYQVGSTTETDLNRLVLSIPDTFIQCFYTIFNFDIFGINVSIFIISVISVGIIIWLLKKVGGK